MPSFPGGFSNVCLCVQARGKRHVFIATWGRRFPRNGFIHVWQGSSSRNYVWFYLRGEKEPVYTCQRIWIHIIGINTSKNSSITQIFLTRQKILVIGPTNNCDMCKWTLCRMWKKSSQTFLCLSILILACKRVEGESYYDPLWQIKFWHELSLSQSALHSRNFFHIIQKLKALLCDTFSSSSPPSSLQSHEKISARVCVCDLLSLWHVCK